MNQIKAAIAAMAFAALGGCGQMQDDLASLIPTPPVKPAMALANTADASPPILQPGCYAIPDRSWDEEGLSEAEPWAPKCKSGAVWPGYHGHEAKLHAERPVRTPRSGAYHQRTK